MKGLEKRSFKRGCQFPSRSSLHSASSAWRRESRKQIMIKRFDHYLTPACYSVNSRWINE